MIRPTHFAALLVSLALPAPLVMAQIGAAPASTASAQAGGTIHGTVMAGKVPLPGVSVTAENTLTGEKYSTATDITGSYTLVIPHNGRYVLRTELTAFAPATKEASLHGGSPAPAVDFSLELASRAQAQQARAGAGAQLLGGTGAQSLDLLGSATDLIQAGGSGGETGAALPSLAGNSDFSSGESVAVTGQNGVTNPFAGVDFSQMRDEAELNESVSGGGAGGRGGPGGGVMVGPGGGGGPRGGGGGGGFRGRGNFRNFKPNQPHGALFWTGGNGALNAEDFALRGQPIQQPAYATNRFGATLFAPPYIPKLLTNDTNDILFLTLFATRSSNPFDQYATVPTAAERSGDFSALTTQNGTPITIYDPAGSNCTADGNTPGQPFVDNKIPATCITTQANALLNYVPQPSLPGSIQNYQRLATADTNNTNIGVRLMHTFGKAGGANPFMRMARQFLGVGGNGITQSMHVNYNYSSSSSDDLNVFSALGGSSHTKQNSLDLGYSIGKGRLTNNLDARWNQTHSQVGNQFSNAVDVASGLQLSGLPSSPQLWGLPNITLDQFTGLNETQPRFSRQETLSLSEMSMWMHGKHNLRLGADVRRVYLDQIGGTNSTGTFTFTGCFTQAPGSCASGNLGSGGDFGLPTTGSSLADLLLGLPQETTIQAANGEAHLRQNAIDWFAQDDWRAGKNVTLLYGLRYEYFSPYSEEHDRLAMLDVSSDFATVAVVTPHASGPFTGRFPRDLVDPEKNNFEPRLGVAWHPMRDTVLRAGYGVNYTVGQYANFVQNFAFAPPFADVQDNNVYTAADEAGVVNCSSFCLANGFPVPESQQIGTWAVNKNYRLPYLQVWNVNLQRTLPSQIVLNVGYNGTKGSRLDVVDAPGRYPETVGGALTTTQPVAAANPALIVPYDYENSLAFSNYNGLAVSARKRLSGGISLQATYTYSHAIDDASSVGGNGGTTCGGTCVAQNWQDLRAEESNSSFDVRHNLRGSFLYELPFGPQTHLLTAGWLGHALANVNFSGSYQFASGNPLTPHYESTSLGVTTGTSDALRPDRVQGASLTTGGGSLTNWFNKAAFATPAGLYGTASRLSIPGPGTVSMDMSISKSIRFGDFKNLEMRATANNVFNTVQYAGVDSTLGSASYGQVTSTAQMRQFSFVGRFRF